MKCYNGGTCKAGVCECIPGYTGESCHEKINKCEQQPCHNKATCVELDKGGFKCHCSDDYEGKYCENKITATKEPPHKETGDKKVRCVQNHKIILYTIYITYPTKYSQHNCM